MLVVHFTMGHHPVAAALQLGILQACLLLGAGAYSIGDDALRGVWRLTSLDDEGLPFERRQKQRREPLPPLPMKEFTIYPPNRSEKRAEIFIRLLDDHTFQQCADLSFGDDGAQESSLEQELQREVTKREKKSFAGKGTWDFVDGKLILAVDRPETKKPFGVHNYGETTSDGEGGDATADTILVGRVLAESKESLAANPALKERQISSSSHRQPKTSTVDARLSVQGKIKTGKFMYPKTHPSFFEQPIIVRSQSKGRFELRQILGEPNAKLACDDDVQMELFRKRDLVGKRFYLFQYPLPKRRKKFERWDMTQSRFVEVDYEPTAEEKQREETEPGKNIQAMAVELFANNTFSTLSGLGSSTVLRGKWSIVGEKRDQLLMMVYRFGFGRSVAGATYSEGTSLNQNDDKGYWGEITEVEDSDKGLRKKIQIEGTVHATPYARIRDSVGMFKMIEMGKEALDEDEREEDDGMGVNDVVENANILDSILAADDSDADDSSEAFDLPGAFE